ncbi:MAG: hypothetical protein Tsb0014_37980 [Pleurocapsa sp.]
MIDNKIKQWCMKNGWTEPRQLEDGLWVAFPPGGFIETPLPDRHQQQLSGKTSSLLNIVGASLLILATIFVGAIALLISPFFINPLIKYYRRSS